LLIAHMSCQPTDLIRKFGAWKNFFFLVEKINLENFVSWVDDVKGLSNRSKGFDEMSKIKKTFSISWCFLCLIKMKSFAQNENWKYHLKNIALLTILWIWNISLVVKVSGWELEDCWLEPQHLRVHIYHPQAKRVES